MASIFKAREKGVFFFVLLVGVSLVFFQFVFCPVFRRQRALNQELHSAGKKLFTYQWLIARKKAIEDQYKQFSPNFSLSSWGTEEATDGLTEIEDLAKKSGIRIVDMRPQGGGTLQEKRPREWRIELRTQGDIEGHLKFIYNLEYVPSLFQIRKLRLAARLSGGSLEGDFSLTRQPLIAD